MWNLLDQFTNFKVKINVNFNFHSSSNSSFNFNSSSNFRLNFDFICTFIRTVLHYSVLYCV
jgi:hypothetical protein